MTRQTVTAFVSAAAFVALAVLLAVVPVPFVTWSPGGAQDTLGAVGGEPMITIEGVQSHPTTGRLDLTTLLDVSAVPELSAAPVQQQFFLALGAALRLEDASA